VIRIERHDVALLVDQDVLTVHINTPPMTITIPLTNEELIRLTAELYGLDPAPLLCGTTPETSCKPGCCRG
jgi:hypothetical protein